MLEFLRKYQKYFLFVVTTMLITSFVFFGTFSTFMDVDKREDKTIGKAINGSDMKLLEMMALSKFLSADREDAVAGERTRREINLCNDGVIRRDLLATGVADLLIRGNYPLFKAQIDHKLQRVKTYRSYEHPEAPFLSAKAIWQRFAPDINREWSFLQSESSGNEETFSHLVNLYQLQSALPAEWLRRVLILHEQQYGWLPPDPRLRQDDLALFGFHSLSDWFGKDFVDLMAEFIHNGAIRAEEMGYKVSLEEAKCDLKRNFAESIQRLKGEKWTVEWSYKDQLRMLGMDEAEAAKIWRKVLLYRRSVQDLGGAAFLDRLPFTEFAALAQEKATFDLYQWPAALKMTTAVDLYAFQTYLKSISPSVQGNALPSSLYSVAEVAQKTPELVGVEYKAKVFAVDKREVSLKASLKEVWECETGDAIWPLLRQEFAFLQNVFGRTAEERFQVLGKLAPEERSRVDFFARRLLVDKNPHWVDETLRVAEGKEMNLLLSNGKIELPHIDDPVRLAALFEEIPSSPETALASLSHFDSQEAVFRFENIEKLSLPKIKTYEEARKDGSLMALVDAALEKKGSGSKEETAALLLADLKKIAEKDTSLATSYWKALASRAKEDLSAHQNEALWLRVEGEDPLLTQFKMERIEKEITRTAEEDWMAKVPFILTPNQWSTVHAAKDGLVQFIFLQSRVAPKAPILDQIFFGKGMITADVQRVLAENLLDSMQRKKSIVIPLQQEQE